MTIKVKIYNGSKYKTESELAQEIIYKDVNCFEVYKGEQFRDGALDGFDELDECNEYLVLYFADGDTATFRNSRVDIFKC